MSFDSVNTRRHPRYLFSDNIEFRLDYSGAGPRLRGISVNISDSGMCLYTSKPIYVGQTVSLETDLPVPYKKASVMWVQNRTEDLYRAGLMFKTAARRYARTGVKAALLEGS